MALGRPLGAKLFMEGMEVPFIGATITSAIGQASIAYIDLVPQQEILQIKPRTKVELFVRNYLDDSSDYPGQEPFPYVLAWQGEVFGINFGKTVTSRSFSISCIDISSYWDCCLSYYFNAQQSLGAGNSQKSSGALEFNDIGKTGERVIVTTFPEASAFKNIMQKVLKEGSGKDFLDAFVGLYKYVGYVNEFFNLADHRLRISDQIVMHSSSRLDQLLTEAEGLEWYSGIPGKTTGYTSLRGVINDLMNLIFHDFSAPAFPARITRKEAFSDTTRKGLPIASKATKTIGSFVFKPNLYMMPPPVCNIFFPDEYSSFQFSRTFFKEPTRLIYQPELPARWGNNADAVYLAHVYEPPSFNHYMKYSKGGYEDYKGTDDIEVPKSTKSFHCLDPQDTTTQEGKDFSLVNDGVKKEWSFLTNEEYMKGIWLYRETMMPATSQFRASLTDFERKEGFTRKIARYLFYKRRFQDRQVQITSHLKLSVLPGFPVLIMDDSDADMNIVAYCSSVTHRIYATEGGYTNTHLSYARTVTEENSASSNGNALNIPPWFDQQIFGTIATPPESGAAKDEVVAKGVTHVSPAKLSDFYKSIIGDEGYKSITNYFNKPDEVTVLGAVRRLQQEYRARKAKGTYDVQQFIADMTSRDYVKMKDYYTFLGATTETKNVETENWIEFIGDVFTRKGKPDEAAVKSRWTVVERYRTILQTTRGFRG